MTQPAQAKTTKKGRMYAWPPTPPHEFEVYSVTTLLGEADDKPWMAPWRVKMVVEYAVEKVEEWVHMARGDVGSKERAKRLLKGEQWGTSSSISKHKAGIGTVAHAAADRYAAGDPMDWQEVGNALTKENVPGEFHSTAFGYVKAAYKFLDEVRPEIIHREATVYSREHEYAGTLDMQARLRIGDSKLLAVVDYKSSASIYDDVALQLVAYSRADFVGRDDGSELPLERADYGVIVQLLDNGEYVLHTFALNDELFEVFLAAKAVAEAKLDPTWDEKHRKSILKRSRRPS